MRGDCAKFKKGRRQDQGHGPNAFSPSLTKRHVRTPWQCDPAHPTRRSSSSSGSTCFSSLAISTTSWPAGTLRSRRRKVLKGFVLEKHRTFSTCHMRPSVFPIQLAGLTWTAGKTYAARLTLGDSQIGQHSCGLLWWELFSELSRSSAVSVVRRLVVMRG